MNKFFWTSIIGAAYLVLFGSLMAGGFWVAMICLWLFETRNPDAATYHVSKDLDS